MSGCASGDAVSGDVPHGVACPVSGDAVPGAVSARESGDVSGDVSG